MLINPSRETFINFPSSVLPDKAVTVFLPEPSVPLRGRYPVVYLLGAGPKDAQSARQLLEQSPRKAILVGVNTDEKELADTEKISTFFSRELIPYIDTNYSTVDDPSARAVVSDGAAGAKALAALLARKRLFARAVVLNGGEEPVSLAESDASLRMLVAGRRADAAVWQRMLRERGLSYGPGFVTALGGDKTLWEALDLAYLFAPAEELTVKKLEGAAFPARLSLSEGGKSVLSVTAVLADKKRFDYIAPSVRFSPPYLTWDAQQGTLEAVNGAVPGKVTLSFGVDKAVFKSKIKLKK